MSSNESSCSESVGFHQRVQSRYVNSAERSVRYSRLCFDIGWFALAFWLLLFSVSFSIESVTSRVIINFVLLAFSVGFALDMTKWIRKNWKSPVVAIPVGLIGLLALALSGSMADRFIISMTSENPEFFSSGREVFRALLLPAAWLSLASLVAGFSCVIFMIHSFFRESWLYSAWHWLHEYLDVPIPSKSAGIGIFSLNYIIGALSLSAVLALPFVWQWPQSFFSEYVAPPILAVSEYSLEHPCVNIEPTAAVSFLDEDRISVVRQLDGVPKLQFSTDYCVRAGSS